MTRPNKTAQNNAERKRTLCLFFFCREEFMHFAKDSQAQSGFVAKFILRIYDENGRKKGGRTMNAGTFFVILILITAMVLDIRYLMRHKSGCAGDCSSCGGSCKWSDDLKRARKEIQTERAQKADADLS